MKILQKCLIPLAMCLVLGLGAGQLTVNASSGNCPPYRCEDLFTCAVGVFPTGTCWDGYRQQYVYPVEGCTIAVECYSSGSFGP